MRFAAVIATPPNAAACSWSLLTSLFQERLVEEANDAALVLGRVSVDAAGVLRAGHLQIAFGLPAAAKYLGCLVSSPPMPGTA